jgi:glucose-6-phosphate isomerase
MMSRPELDHRISISPGGYHGSYSEALQFLDRERFAQKIWSKDAAVWKSSPEIREKIKNRLGWLTVVRDMAKEADALMVQAKSVQEAGFKHVVLMGMGGSSLCPEVCRRTYGVRPGFPELVVLDSTDPATIRRVEEPLDFRRTLFILASKSGTTIEVQSLYRHFMEKLTAIQLKSAGRQFMAITDPGTPLEDLARTEGFRKVFLNPADIGGRYSALSYFGLVPAALIGLDLNEFLNRAQEMAHHCGPDVPSADHPAVSLGAVLGGLGKVGVDKVTLVSSEPIGSFGVWIEQLVAESTGKEGKGLLPVDGERLGAPALYGEDRLFVHLGLANAPDVELEEKVSVLEEAGHPVVRITLSDPMDLAGEFFRWEMATAAAGSVLGINPFDEPNVSESKSNTASALDQFNRDGALGLPEPVAEEDGIGICGSFMGGEGGSPKDIVERFLVRAGTKDFVAILAYIEQNGIHESILQEIRHKIRNRYHVATTLGYGPRYLHSTGQFHKGGPGNGMFIQITAKEAEDIPIPGGVYGFGILKRAQALGDYLSLQERGRRIIEIRLGRHVEGDLRKLARWLRLG